MGNVETRFGVLKLRTRLGWSQQHFAEVLGVSMMTVSRWETGKFKPSPMAMGKLEKLESERVAK